MANKKLLTVKDVAEYYQITEAAVRGKVQRRDNTIPMPRKIGKRLYWTQEDLDNHVKGFLRLGELI